MTPAMLKRFKVKNIFYFDYALRCFSGLLWAFACSWKVGSQATLPLLYASRLLYGFTLNSFAIPQIWIGIRLKAVDRAGRELRAA